VSSFRKWDACDVRELMALRDMGNDRFANIVGHRNHNGKLFGGQLMGLAIEAASRTVQAKNCHAASGYFVRGADYARPVEIAVDRLFDGNSFCLRRVTVSQGDQSIFHLEASFQRQEEGPSRTIKAPDQPAPQALARTADLDPGAVADLTQTQRKRIYVLPGIDMRPVSPNDYLVGRPDGRRSIWMRAPSAEGASEATHRALIAHFTDFVLTSTATLPQEEADGVRALAASLNQSIWFLRAHPADRWMRFDCDTPSAQNGRGIARADIFDEDGIIVATTAQEALIRQPRATQPT